MVPTVHHQQTLRPQDQTNSTLRAHSSLISPPSFIIILIQFFRLHLESVSLSYTLPMTTPISMPARGEDAAPIFDKLRPRELPRFFHNLECLFEQAAITSEADKKRHTLRYVDFDIEELWRAIPEFADPTKTYAEFKAGILYFYPDEYSLSDVDALIGERLRLGINSVKDLAVFHRRFLAITKWLIDRRQLCDLEQQRSYIRAFPLSLLSPILTRLQIKLPNHRPHIPYKVSDIYEAAQLVLEFPSPSVN